MKFAIIAAGEGSRLAQEGIEQPKPLVEVAGEKLIDRLIRIFQQNGAEEIVIIVNTLTNKVEKHLNTLQTKVPLRIVSKTTPSSMHSFAEIAPYLGDAPFCLTTVDTIFDEQEFTDYINHFQESKIDGLMAVTDYIDDEKPLYVTTNEKCGVTGFFDSIDDYTKTQQPETSQCRFISGGIYTLTPQALQTLTNCMNQGKSRMRNFQRQLIADGLNIKAYPFTKILDVDHIGDIEKAEHFLLNLPRPTNGNSRN